MQFTVGLHLAMTEDIKVGDPVRASRPYWWDNYCGRVIEVDGKAILVNMPEYDNKIKGLKEEFVKISEAEYFRWKLKHGVKEVKK